MCLCASRRNMLVWTVLLLLLLSWVPRRIQPLGPQSGAALCIVMRRVRPMTRTRRGKWNCRPVPEILPPEAPHRQIVH
jgi:hypothetical protein